VLRITLIVLSIVALAQLGCTEDPEEQGDLNGEENEDIDVEDKEGKSGEDSGNAPRILPAEPLTIESGCVTYVGNHLKYPDGEHSQKYEFCADGTMTKTWNPVPGQDPPGDLTCPGTWSGSGGQLEIKFKCNAGFPNNNSESYEYVFTYEDGAKLDLLGGKAQVEPGDGSTVVGTYEASSYTVLDMGTIMDMEIIADETTVVTDDQWETTSHVILTCVGMVCNLYPDYNSDNTTVTSGPLTNPGTLYDMGGTYMLQTSTKVVLERQ